MMSQKYMFNEIGKITLKNLRCLTKEVLRLLYIIKLNSMKPGASFRLYIYLK